RKSWWQSQRRRAAMSEAVKITASHLARMAIVYLRQSSAAQVEHNRESTDRQYALVNKAGDLGWPADKIIVIDEDLGVTGSGAVARSGFARLTAEVALGHVGLVLGLEVSRLARNNADCFLHLGDLCYLHPEAAPAGAIAHMKTLEAAVIAEKAAREKQLADGRERAERRREAERQKAAAEQAKAG